MTLPIYPLAQVLLIKQKRVEEAQRIVKEKLDALEKEKKTLRELEEKRDKAKELYQRKLTQMRELMDSESTSPKLQQLKNYLKIVKEQLVEHDNKVAAQQKQVDAAQKNYDLAKEDLRLKQLEVDKFIEHRKDWTKEMLKEQEIIQGREQDELGSMIFTVNSRKKETL